ncbi:GFA family protein [Methylocaldum sp.]|uniref:GFA family protein n=1 Tax=Methylocaldum sp. TaxID=1969727 RepID=UPI002D6DA417|nr:GFA family protein [Methylocaldum sp.]HYE36467.1 GFA family protein [Methylocaldum sp.]
MRRKTMIYRGSCHCEAVQFEVEAPERVVCQDCNCSICSKSGFLHLIVPKSQFKLLKGEENLTAYTFNTGVARHLFCKTCGIKPFYIPRSNPDGYDVNVRCLTPQPKELVIEPFDGRNWESHAHELAHLSREA